MLRDQIDAIGVGVGKVGTYGGGGATVLSAMTLHDWGIAAGIVIGVLGYVTQVFFNRRRDRRERLEFEANERREQAKFEREMSRYGGTG